MSTSLLRARILKLVALLLALLGILATTSQSPASAAASNGGAWPMAPRALPGWKADFIDDFDGPLNTKVWGRYAGETPAIGTASLYRYANAAVDTEADGTDGALKITTQREADGTWTSAGMSSARGFKGVGGKWVIKAKFQRATGAGYAFLLYPTGNVWPPEIDIAEGTAAGPRLLGAFHYGTKENHLRDFRFRSGVDMTKWHTYGVIIAKGQIDYTIDGVAWFTVRNDASPYETPMWLGLQAGVNVCTPTSGECMSDQTPTRSTIEVDWIAHYTKA